MAANQNLTQITNIQVVFDPTTIFYGVPLSTNMDTSFTGQVLSTWLLANSNLTGIPVAPTAAINTNTTQLATTAYVVNQGYLTTASAASTYLTQANAASTYLTIATAASTYATITNLALKAPLASPTFTGTVTTAALTSTGNFTPSQTNGIVGTTTNNNANAGSVGEYVTATGTAVSITTSTLTNVTSVSLTAGDWEISSSLTFLPAASTTMSLLVGGISSTTAALPADPFTWLVQSTGLTPGAKQSSAIPTQRFSLPSTTTIFLVAEALFGVSTMTATGILRARRVR